MRHFSLLLLLPHALFLLINIDCYSPSPGFLEPFFFSFIQKSFAQFSSHNFLIHPYLIFRSRTSKKNFFCFHFFKFFFLLFISKNSEEYFRNENFRIRKKFKQIFIFQNHNATVAIWSSSPERKFCYSFNLNSIQNYIEESLYK